MALKFSDIFNTSDININNPKIEEMLNKTKDVAEMVGKKSAEHIEISRKKIECIDAKAKLAKAYEKYGQLQYNAVCGEDVELSEIESVALRITELKEKIDFLNSEIEAAKSEFNEKVSAATKKTKEAFKKEFDKSSGQASTPSDDEIDVTEFIEQEE